MMIKPKVVSISSNRKLRTVQISKPKVIITKLDEEICSGLSIEFGSTVKFYGSVYGDCGNI